MGGSTRQAVKWTDPNGLLTETMMKNRTVSNIAKFTNPVLYYTYKGFDAKGKDLSPSKVITPAVQPISAIVPKIGNTIAPIGGALPAAAAAPKMSSTPPPLAPEPAKMNAVSAANQQTIAPNTYQSPSINGLKFGGY